MACGSTFDTCSDAKQILTWHVTSNECILQDWSSFEEFFLNIFWSKSISCYFIHFLYLSKDAVNYIMVEPGLCYAYEVEY